MYLSLGFWFCSIDLYFCLCASTILSWWLTLEYNLKSDRLILQVPFFFLKIALTIQSFLYLHTTYEIICSSSVKNISVSNNILSSRIIEYNSMLNNCEPPTQLSNFRLPQCPFCLSYQIVTISNYIRKSRINFYEILFQRLPYNLKI